MQNKNVAEDRFVERLSRSTVRAITATQKPSDGLVYPKTPYHNENRQQRARRLSRMSDSQRVLAKAIHRTTKPGKESWENKWSSIDQTLTYNNVQLPSRKWAEWR